MKYACCFSLNNLEIKNCPHALLILWVSVTSASNEKVRTYISWLKMPITSRKWNEVNDVSFTLKGSFPRCYREDRRGVESLRTSRNRLKCRRPSAALCFAQEIIPETIRISVQLCTWAMSWKEKRLPLSCFPLMNFEGFLFTKEIMNASCKVCVGWRGVSSLKVTENMFCSHLQTLGQIALFSKELTQGSALK